jgi:hypothetical protein
MLDSEAAAALATLTFAGIGSVVRCWQNRRMYLFQKRIHKLRTRSERLHPNGHEGSAGKDVGLRDR